MLEQHPVPQNVTTFQFRLIGDMTIKQFGYLAGGAILAYISFNLPLPFFFSYPLTGLFILGGIGFAFVPIEERPMDVWFLSFIRSVYSPTQYLWQREAYKEPIATVSMQATQTKTPVSLWASLFDFSFLLPPKKAVPQAASIPHATSVIPTVAISPTPTQKAASKSPSSSWLSSFLTPTVQPQGKPKPVGAPRQPVPAPAVSYAPNPYVMASAPLPSVDGTHLTLPNSHPPQTQKNQPAPQQKSEDHDNGRVTSLEQKLKEMEEALKKQESSREQMTKLQEQLVGALSEKEKLEKQLEAIRHQMSQQQKAPETTRAAGSTGVNQRLSQPTVNVFTPDGARSAGIPTLTTFANVITGIVRERTGNLLVGILVTVKDKEDIPVRALKTNKLGQFAASTPLASGTYTLEIEDPKGQFSFDQARVVLSGNVLPAIEIIAKSKQELERQKLEQALFGKTNM